MARLNPDDPVNETHARILSAFWLYGRTGDYSGVYEALPGIPEGTIRYVGSLYGVGDRLRSGRQPCASPIVGHEPLDVDDVPDNDPAPADVVYADDPSTLPYAQRPVLKGLVAATKRFEDRLSSKKLEWPEPPARKADSRIALVVGLVDVHLGKLAWAPETGDDYDLQIAGKVFKNAVIDLIEEVGPDRIDQAILPIGNDFFNFDNLLSTTTKGTSVDSDGRYPKVFDRGVQLCEFAVEVLRATGAEVHLLWVPGNHDRLSSYHLIRELRWIFKGVDGIHVDTSPKTRKYHPYGRNLFGFTHGEKESHRDLPAIMAAECRREIGDKTDCDWFVGHWHRSKRTSQLPEEDSFVGGRVNVLPSLSGKDSYLYEQGYISGGRAALGYYYDRELGRRGYVEVRPRSS